MPIVSQVFIDTLIPVFFVLGLGYYAGLLGRIDNRDTSALNVALMHFALPCSLFLAVAKTSLWSLKSQTHLIAAITIAMVLTYASIFYLSRNIFRATVPEAAVNSLTVAFANNVAIGLPLLLSLYGTVGVIAVAVSIVAGVLVISPVTLVLLECSRTSREESTRSFPRLLASAVFASVRRPIILAPLVGLLFPILRLSVPIVFANSLDLLGKATIGLALFLTGLIFSAQPIHFSPGVVTAVFAKNIAQPAIMVLLIFIFQLHGDLMREALLLTALPAGFFGTVFGARYGVNSTDASSTVVLSTALSAITIPVILVLSAHLP